LRLSEREKAGTPTLDNSRLLDESVLSGYDGDREDEDESFLDYDGKYSRLERGSKSKRVGR
jgi:hypothetical protein